jgi:hypothetical protein
MTKLEELKADWAAAEDALDAAWEAADAAWEDADVAYYAAWVAYKAELKKIQEENSND